MGPHCAAQAHDGDVPTIFTHAIVGLGLASIAPVRRRRPLFWVLSAMLPVLPDIDVVAFALGVSSASMWSHRGLTHSLAGAALTGLVVGICVARSLSLPTWAMIAYFAVVTASHGLLDALTNGGSGVAFFAPVAATRYFLPWRPVEVSPLGMAFFSAWGLRVIQSEALWIWLPGALALVAVRGAWTLCFRGDSADYRREGDRD